MTTADMLVGRMLGNQMLENRGKLQDTASVKNETLTKVKLQTAFIALAAFALFTAACVCHNPDLTRAFAVTGVATLAMMPMPYAASKFSKMLEGDKRNEVPFTVRDRM